MVLFYYFTESATSAAYDTEYDVPSFVLLGMSSQMGQLVLLGIDSVEHMFFLYNPQSVGTGT